MRSDPSPSVPAAHDRARVHVPKRAAALFIALLSVVTVLSVLTSCQPDREKLQTPQDPGPATGACCDPATGNCVITTEDTCGQFTPERVYRGDGAVCAPNPCPHEPGTDYYSASQQVGSTGHAEIHAESGAGLHVPMYAVPLLADSSEARMVFSIERDQSVAPVLPAGVTKASDVYRFGPEGFTFGEMVEVTVPYTGALSGRNLALYRINQTSGQSEPYAGVVDTVARTVSAMTYKLSPWYVGGAPTVNTAYGAFHVANISTGYWLNLCVESYQLKYPEADAGFTGDANCAWAPPGEIGWASQGNWYLPQGTYTFCVEMSRTGTLLSPPGPPYRTQVTKVLDAAWSHDQPFTTELGAFGGPGPDWQQAPCACVPVATVPVGTGQVQVTLNWHSTQHVDLDLWVTEPGGERCFYAHSTTGTGGQLDRDNACSNYEDGRPENIFWSSAPTGEYKVEVDWFNVCSGSDAASMPFDLRVVNGTNVRTYTMTCPRDSTIEVTRFNVTTAENALSRGESGGSSRLVQGEPIGIIRPQSPRPAKH